MAAPERLVFLDTETTGLDARLGHRIIEVAAVEALGRQTTGRSVHFYVDPERDIDSGATAVHGYVWEDLRGKPKFAMIAAPLMDFLSGARVVIHNAPFDVAFLDQELARLRQPPVSARNFSVEDSLALARQKYPGKRNSLDALCDRLGVDNSQRNLHGALLDARLLADVYFALTRVQGSLEISPVAIPTQPVMPVAPNNRPAIRPDICAVQILAEEEATHARYIERLNEQSGRTLSW